MPADDPTPADDAANDSATGHPLGRADEPAPPRPGPRPEDAATLAAVAGWLRRRGLAHGEASDAVRLRVPLGTAEAPAPPALVTVRPSPLRGLSFRAVGPRTFADDDLGRAARLANRWNARHPAPRAVLVPRPDGTATVVLDGWLPAAGVPEDDAIALFLDAHLRGTRRFWSAVDFGDLASPSPSPDLDEAPATEPDPATGAEPEPEPAPDAAADDTLEGPFS